VNRTGSLLASDFGKGQALAKHLRNDKREAVSIGQGIVFGCAVVVAKNLFVYVTEQMKRLYSNVGSMQPAFEKRPEVFKAVSVYAAFYVLDRMVHNIMRIDASEFVVGDGIVGVELRSELDLIQNLVLQSLAFYVWHNLRPDAAEGRGRGFPARQPAPRA